MVNTIFVTGICSDKDFIVASDVLGNARKLQIQGKLTNSFDGRLKGMLPKQYARWLQRQNAANQWNHKDRLIAWQELCEKGGPKQYIGGLDRFLEFMYENYRVRRSLSTEDATRLAELTLEQKTNDALIENNKVTKAVYNVTIITDNHPGASLLAYEILKHERIRRADGVRLTLTDYSKSNSHERLADLKKDLLRMGNLKNGSNSVHVVGLKKSLVDCDLLVVFGDDRRSSWTMLEEVSFRYRLFKSLGLYVGNTAIKPSLKVVFTCMNYICFNSTVFLRFATNVNRRNFVASTGYLSREPLSYISQASGIPICNINVRSVPVWGFVGVNHLVDLANATMVYNQQQFHDVGLVDPSKVHMDYVSFDNASFGKERWIERNMGYILNTLENVWLYVGLQKENVYRKTGRDPYLSKVTATLDLLDYWHMSEQHAIGKPIFAGFYSDGSYGFPRGLVMSQPAVIDNETNLWRISHDVPLPRDSLVTLKDLTETALSVIYSVKNTGGKLFKLLETGEIKLNFPKPTITRSEDGVIDIAKEMLERMDEEESHADEEEAEDEEDKVEEEEEEHDDDFRKYEALKPDPVLTMIKPGGVADVPILVALKNVITNTRFLYGTYFNRSTPDKDEFFKTAVNDENYKGKKHGVMRNDYDTHLLDLNRREHKAWLDTLREKFRDVLYDSEEAQAQQEKFTYLPDKVNKFKVDVPWFEPPEQEVGENDILYEDRVSQCRMEFLRARQNHIVRKRKEMVSGK